ncbi:McrB family protein [Rothia nasimurium]|uniref:McrB family protein n=1 Tax=Rothia nasimurium TaxID=85336 RepID=UPI001F016C09|nr:AAA family ATPase [Rothia nasimurium]
MTQEGMSVSWIIPKEHGEESYEKISDSDENNSITFKDFLKIDFSTNKICSSVSVDLKYSGEDLEVKDVLKKFKDSYKVGKASTIGQTLFALAKYSESSPFIKFIEEQGDEFWPLSGTVPAKSSCFQFFLKYFLEYKGIDALSSVEMVGSQSSKVTRGGNKFTTSKEKELLSGVEPWSYGECAGMSKNIVITDRNTILEGVAGSGKTYYQRYLIDPNHELNTKNFSAKNTETVVFHPSTSYEDFVSGLRPLKDGGFTGKAGIFVELCNRAAAEPENNYLLFIDEINRANTAKVFGDLLMVIEESKRTPVANLETYKRAVLTRSEAKSLGITSVRLQSAIDTLPEKAKPPVGKDKDDVDLEYLAVPDNLYIVGTMNSTDRSVGTIDLALRRRFTWHTMEPMTAKELRGKDKVKDRTDLDHPNSLLSWYDEANEKLYKKVGPDARLGHSYFFQGDKSAQQIAHDLLKQLAEIFYIFHLEDLIAEEPFNRPIQGLQLKNIGEGLGQKVIVKQFSANSSGKASGKPEPAESDSGKSPKNLQES